MAMSHTNPWNIDASGYPQNGPWADRLTFLLRYATLAPSSHNTQPWSFRVRENAADLFIEETRWLKVADVDQRELHISIGCTLENLLVAAEHFGLDCETDYLPDSKNPMLAATVRIQRRGKISKERPASLFPMIGIRHTNHGEYESTAIPVDILDQFQKVCVESGVILYMTSDLEIRQRVDELVIHADALEFANPAFREELGYWIGQGVFGTSWLISKIGKLAVTYVNMGTSQGKKDSSVLMSSPVLGLISSDVNDRISQIKVGQVYQRLSLLAASFGIWTQPMSQILQVEECRNLVADLQPNPKLFPQHPFRMGYAPPEKHHTPRRELFEMLK
ncbi:MAG: Acg family FMN-binding oxidoreductase [Pirellula sp.]